MSPWPDFASLQRSVMAMNTRKPTCGLCKGKKVKLKVGRLATKAAPFDDPDYLVMICPKCDQ